MKLAKALNGDWVDLEKVTSFNVADIGRKVVVYARIHTQSWELYSTPYTDNREAAIELAEGYLADLRVGMESADNFWTMSIEQSPELLEALKAVSTTTEVNSWTFKLAAAKLPEGSKVESIKPVKRTRKPKQTGEEG